jgi:hypothetical protein
VARPRRARENTKNKGLAWLTTFNARTDLQGLSPASANLSDDGPPEPEKQTAAPTGIGSGGKIQAKAANFRKSEYVGAGPSAITKLPSRAVLARRFPKLRLNRFTGAWCDDASGAHGRDVGSLLAFLEQGRAGQ